jgi:hypothetical protein
VTDSTGTPSTPAGWYADPAGSDRLRWWDGTRWTDHLADAPTAAAGAAGASSGSASATGQTGSAEQAAHATSSSAPAYGQAAQQPYSQQPYAQQPYAQAAYAAPTPPPQVPASTSPWTWAIWVLAALPVVSLILLSGIDFRETMPTSPSGRGTMMPGLGMVLIQLVGFLLYGAAVLVAYLDWRDLGRRGFVRPFHWAWAFLGSGVYVIGRSIIVRRRIEGTPGRALSPIWLWAGLTLLVSFVVIGKWLEAFMDAMQRYSPSGY